MARDVNVFVAGNIYYNDHSKGWALKTAETFLGPEMAASEASAFWGTKKSRFSGPTPSNGPSNRFACIKLKFGIE